jgi:hypothetical protein
MDSYLLQTSYPLLFLSCCFLSLLSAISACPHFLARCLLLISSHSLVAVYVRNLCTFLLYTYFTITARLGIHLLVSIIMLFIIVVLFFLVFFFTTYVCTTRNLSHLHLIPLRNFNFSLRSQMLLVLSIFSFEKAKRELIAVLVPFSDNTCEKLERICD